MYKCLCKAKKKRLWPLSLINKEMPHLYQEKEGIGHLKTSQISSPPIIKPEPKLLVTD